MWLTLLSFLKDIKVPLWLFLIVALAAGGLYGLHWYESGKIDDLKIEVYDLKKEKSRLEAIVKEKDGKIETLQLTIEKAHKDDEAAQKRTTELIKVISTFGKPVVIPATGKNELNAINKEASDKFLKWLNVEVWQ